MTTIDLHGIDPAELEMVRQLVTSMPLESPLSVALRAVLAAASRGADLVMLANDQELTPNQAAERLKMSRPHLLKLMERGLIGYRMVGTNRRISVSELVDYMHRNGRVNAHVSEGLSIRGQGVAPKAAAE